MKRGERGFTLSVWLFALTAVFGLVYSVLQTWKAIDVVLIDEAICNTVVGEGYAVFGATNVEFASKPSIAINVDPTLDNDPTLGKASGANTLGVIGGRQTVLANTATAGQVADFIIQANGWVLSTANANTIFPGVPGIDRIYSKFAPTAGGLMLYLGLDVVDDCAVNIYVRSDLNGSDLNQFDCVADGDCQVRTFLTKRPGRSGDVEINRVPRISNDSNGTEPQFPE